MTEQELGNFILNAPLYKKYTYTDLETPTLDLLFFNGHVDCFCPGCGNHSIFTGENNDPERVQRKSTLGLTNTIIMGKPKKEDIFDGVYTLDFCCSRNLRHKLIFFFKVETDKFFKVGQSPSLLEISQGDIKAYKKLLGDYFSDLNSAVVLNSNNFGVGAFTHLRRIIENFFMAQAYSKWQLKKLPTDDTDLISLRFREKLSLLKAYLPDSITGNTTLYSIVSSGIHSLGEEECKDYFDPVFHCIIQALDELLSEEKKKANDEKIKQSLSKIASKIGK